MIAAIVCVDENNGIGYNNNLLAKIPEDIKFFKDMTESNIVVMGRKTFESIGEKPLKNRANIVVTTYAKQLENIYRSQFNSQDKITFVKPDDVISLIKFLNINENNEIYVIGGQQTYEMLLPYCDTIYKTRLMKSFENVDTFFPETNDFENIYTTETKNSKNGIQYRFEIMKRIKNNSDETRGKQVFIINGSGGVGKDTFVSCVRHFCNAINYSSVDLIKRAARILGWNGGKTEEDRKFLSDLKSLCAKYNDAPFRDICDIVNNFKECEHKYLFLHIREPEEIERAKKEFNAKTILITRESVSEITTNDSDKNVNNYQYDYIVENNGTLDDLMQKAKDFIENFER